MPKNERATIYILWPGDTSAKSEHASSTRTIAMLLGGPYKKLTITKYGRDSRVAYYRIENGTNGKVAFFVQLHNENFPTRATDHEHSVLQSDAIRYAAARVVIPSPYPEESCNASTHENPTEKLENARIRV